MLTAYVAGGIVSLALMFTYAFFSRRKLKIRFFILIPTVVIAGSLYIYAYLQYFKFLGGGTADFRDVIKSLLRAIFSTARMFAFNDDYAVITGYDSFPQELEKAAFLVPFWLCHVSAVSLTVAVIISAFGRKLASNIKRILSVRRARYIIYGVNTKSLCFARNILTDKESGRVLIVFVDNNIGEIERKAIQTIGAVLLEENLFQESGINTDALKKAGLKKSLFKYPICAFAFSDSSVKNFNAANGIWEHAVTLRISSSRLKGIYVSTDSDALADILIKKRDKASEKQKYNLGFSSEGDLAARKLFEAEPLYRRLCFNSETGLPVKENAYTLPTLTVVILGFGQTGKQVLKQAILTGQYAGCSFYAAVFDRQIDSEEGIYRKEYPGLFDNNCPNKIRIDMHRAAFGSKDFYDEIDAVLRRTGRIDYIISCLDDDDMNFEAIVRLRRLFSLKRFACRHPVFAAHITDNKYAVLKSVSLEFSGIISFGDYENILNRETIICEEMDILARAVNSVYIRKCGNEILKRLPEEGVPPTLKEEWDMLSVHFKNSNRAAAAFISAQLYILGLELIPGNRPDKLTREDFIKVLDEDKNPDRLNVLGETEHLRWNAFHFASGWTVKPLNERNACSSKTDETLKRHVCLVTWEQLAEIQKKTGRDYQGVDRENIRMIFDIIEAYNNDERIRNQNDKKYSIVRRL
jgi:hypothetical protein